MTILQQIDEALHTNERTAEERSKLLAAYYLDGNFSQRASLDQFCLILCGVRLEDLIGTTVSPPPIPLSNEGFPQLELRERAPILITHELAHRLLAHIYWVISARAELRDDLRFQTFIAKEGPHVLRQLMEDNADLTTELHEPVHYVSIGVSATGEDEPTHVFHVDFRGYPAGEIPEEWGHIARIDLAEWQAHNFPAEPPDDMSLPLEECGYWIRLQESEYYILPHPDQR